MGKSKFALIGLVTLVGAALLISVLFIPEEDRNIADDKSDMLSTGKKIYLSDCATCHGENLQGEANWQTVKENGILPAPPHDDSGHTWHHTDELLFDYIKKGGNYIIPGDFKSGMPGFEKTLSDEKIWTVLNYLKSQWSEREQNYQADITKANAKKGE